MSRKQQESQGLDKMKRMGIRLRNKLLIKNDTSVVKNTEIGPDKSNNLINSPEESSVISSISNSLANILPIKNNSINSKIGENNKIVRENEIKEKDYFNGKERLFSLKNTVFRSKNDKINYFHSENSTNKEYLNFVQKNKNMLFSSEIREEESKNCNNPTKKVIQQEIAKFRKKFGKIDEELEKIKKKRNLLTEKEKLLKTKKNKLFFKLSQRELPLDSFKDLKEPQSQVPEPENTYLEERAIENLAELGKRMK